LFKLYKIIIFGYLYRMADNSQMTDNMGGNNPVADQTVAPEVNHTFTQLQKQLFAITPSMKQQMVSVNIPADGGIVQRPVSVLTRDAQTLIDNKSRYGGDVINPMFDTIQQKVNYMYNAFALVVPNASGGRRRTKRSQSKRRRQSKRRGQSRRRRGSRK
jgi:hypothetical protein